MYSESLFPSASRIAPYSVTSGQPEHKFHRSISSNPSLPYKATELPTSDGGFESRVDFTGCTGLDVLDRVFGRGWSLDKSTGVISVTDAAFTRMANADPLERWYNMDTDPIAR